MTPPFGLMMFWLPEMRTRPLWMSAMRRPRMPQTMLAVSVRVTVTLTTLNCVMINLNSVMINVILNFFDGVGAEAVEGSTCHHQLYLQMAENKKKWTAADARNAFVDLSHRGLKMAKSKIDMSTNWDPRTPGPAACSYF